MSGPRPTVVRWRWRHGSPAEPVSGRLHPVICGATARRTRRAVAPRPLPGEPPENLGELVLRLGDRAARRRHTATRAAAVVPADRPERDQPDVVAVRPCDQLLSVGDAE